MSEIAITLTFGEVAENHAGMQQIGDKGEKGFEKDDLEFFKRKFKKAGLVVKTYSLKKFLPEKYHDCKGVQPSDGEAIIMVVKNGLKYFDLSIEEVKEEQLELEYDKKAYMRGRVVNKHARYNLCFDKESQEPDYENKKGTIVAYSDVPKLSQLRNKLSDMISERGFEELKVEGNYYFNPSKCGIGYHGDTERRIVIALRLGEEIPLAYRWYHKCESVSDTIKFDLEEGDMYFMSHKATGNDWRCSSKVTLRHSAGENFITK